MTRLLAVAFKRVNELTRISIIRLKPAPEIVVPWAVSENRSVYETILCIVNKIIQDVAMHFAGIRRTLLFFFSQKLTRYH